MALELTTVLLTLGLMGITGAFAYVLNKIGPIAVWGITSSLMLVSLAFNWTIEMIIGLAALNIILNVIAVVIDG